MKLTVKDLVGIPHTTLSKNKKGNYIIRQAFYYSNGRSEHIIEAALLNKYPTANVVGKGKKLTPFRGGATVANQSHYWVEFNFDTPNTNNL